MRYQGEFAEMDHENGYNQFEARLWDSRLGRWMVPDPAQQFYSPYEGMGNNPIAQIDPDGEFVPLLIGMGVGMIVGALKASKLEDVSIGEGIFKGALTGLIGGALATVGGGTFVANLAWGVFEGGFTGAVNNIIWEGGDNILRDMGRGALWGGAFAAGSALPESIKNAKEGNGFGTDIGRFKSKVDDAVEIDPITGAKVVNESAADHALDYWELKFGGPDLMLDNSNFTDLATGEIGISKGSFLQGHQAVKTAIIHEQGHYYKDIVRELKISENLNGSGINLENSITPQSGISYNPSIGDFSMNGYNNLMKNTGKYNIGLKWAKGGPKYFDHFGSYAGRFYPFNEKHWERSFGIEKWWHLIPRRNLNLFK